MDPPVDKKAHRQRQAGPKALKKKAKNKHEQELTPRQRNPKAFSIQHANKTLKIVQRTQDLKTKKQHIPLVDRTPAEPPPIIVGVVGPPKVGKTTLLKCVVKNFTKQKLTRIQGPVTVVSGKQRRLTLIECNNDINSMIDIAKVADLVLLLVDASFGFEMETFEFLNICQVHGFPRIMGVLTHLDAFRDNKRLRKTKKRLKHRFWTEVYQGAKLFYLSGMINGEYQKTEVHNLCRFISVMKFRPLTWRTTHPYILADRMEDITDPETVRKNEKADRNVSLYGYVHGTHMKNNINIHIPGCGDFPITDMNFMSDPCPSPDLQKKHKSLSQKDRLIFAPMSGVGGIVYDKDAVYIDLGGSHSHTEVRENERPANALVASLMSMTNPVDEKMTSTNVSLFSDSVKDHPEVHMVRRIISKDDKSVLMQMEDGRFRRRATFADEGEDDGGEGDDSSDDDDDEELDDEGIEEDIQAPPEKRRRQDAGDEEVVFVDTDSELEDEDNNVGQPFSRSSARKADLAGSNVELEEVAEESDSDDDDDDESDDDSDGDSVDDNDSDDAEGKQDEKTEVKGKASTLKTGRKSLADDRNIRLTDDKDKAKKSANDLENNSSSSKLEGKSVTSKKRDLEVENVEKRTTELSEKKRNREVDSCDSDEEEEEEEESESGDDNWDNASDSHEEMEDDDDDDEELDDEEEIESDSNDDEETEEDGVQWKSDLATQAAAAFRERQAGRINWRKLIYGSEAGEQEDRKNEEDEDEIGGLFKVLKEKSERSQTDRIVLNSTDCSKFTSDRSKKWDVEQLRELIADCFVTGKWDKSEDAALRLQEDDDLYGDFEDLETGEVHTGKEEGDDDEEDGDEETGITDGAVEEVKKKKSEMTAEERRVEKKRKLKEMFDSQYDMKGDTEFYDAWKAEMDQQAKMNRAEFEGMDDDVRVQYEGFRPGMYVRVEVHGVPCEFVTNFDPTYPVIVGGLLNIENNVGYVLTRFKKHRWHKKILKTRNPLIFSMGWRRFQSIPLYSIQDHNMRNRLLKYTPEHLHCHASIWGPITPQGTGILAVESVSEVRSGFRVAGTGVVLELDKSMQIVKKLKLTGTPLKIYQKTAFIQGMFNSSLEVAKFEGASIRTVSGIRGQIKRAHHKPQGAFRATFEDKILLSDIVFLRTWFPVQVPQFYNPVTSLLLPQEQKHTWQGMKTVGQLRFERSLKVPTQEDSIYKPIVRKGKSYTPLAIPHSLQKMLPFNATPKVLQAQQDPVQRVAVIKEPHERKIAKVLKMLKEVNAHKGRLKNVQMHERVTKHQKAMAKINGLKQQKSKERKKQVFRTLGKKERRTNKFGDD